MCAQTQAPVLPSCSQDWTPKGLCCTPHTALDLQKRSHSQHNRKKCKTGTDKLTTFHKYYIFLYAATSLAFVATPRNKHHWGPTSAVLCKAPMWGVTPEICQTEKDHLHPPSLLGSLPAACARALLPTPTFHTVYVILTAAVMEWASCSLPINGGGLN